MKKIIARLTANNQILFRYTSKPDSIKGKVYGDKSPEKRQEALARHIYEVERINDILRKNCPIEKHKNVINHCMDAIVYNEASNVLEYGQKVNASMQYFNACAIPTEIKYVEVREGRADVISTTYACLTNEKRRYLDIIEKSQYGSEKRRTWGLPQSKKKFTRNAKQKILEAGSVVEMNTSRSDQREITLTIPGSGFDVYAAVANWSGYIVNRLAQVVRNHEKGENEVLWFFVWEHQKRGALHMHWCVAVKGDGEKADAISRQMLAKWYEVLEELSVKTGIDLFKKRGFSGTWRYSPHVWQSQVKPIRKSVAGYFSKYCSKNVEVEEFNETRRNRYAHQSRSSLRGNDKQGTLSLYPSRYWGTSYRVKRLCAQYRIELSFDVANSKEGDQVVGFISKWISEIACIAQKVSRSFKAIDDRTSFVYCSGWDVYLWIENEGLNRVLRMFQRLKSSIRNVRDRFGVLCDLL